VNSESKSRKPETTKTRNQYGFFGFSSFRAFVISYFFFKYSPNFAASNSTFAPSFGTSTFAVQRTLFVRNFR
jgi:hypothetical protein